ncbi:NADH-quinone oxidoreductase subunit L [Sulfurospirillum sp. T05]|uniref:NADH-quinone oxidoreductase subunit L n=1 Tax=Sulfurospirillum tamanense TaxID=2813362 RepID=A0ABS2WQ37_9BACT|nr:NADH-quinone oxidoreductase subunit L [Sulfurospirillum tamanensis]MBN2963518.1 NADH-quinone oxidoreductase subunit L [Sulfurospirillum tamanensis]
MMWIVLVPLLGAIVLGGLYLFSLHVRPVSRKIFFAIGVATPWMSFVMSLWVLKTFLEQQAPVVYEAYTWLHVGDFHIRMGFMGDTLSLFMALFITFIGGLIHVYAGGYMAKDAGFGKFFAFFNLFLASMLVLVLASSPVVMFIGWEGVGICSYALIGYYHQKRANVEAGNKAFLANRVGDFGFIVGLCTLFVMIGSAGFDYASLEENIHLVESGTLHFIGAMLFIGAMGKSAQLPLHVWLPDAMAGPTPVSALIHAATMVTAGVYMVARLGFLYDLIPSVGLWIAYIGAGSSLFAALVATRQSDIKKILAYSTMSQLGYMFVAVGIGSYGAGLFHVFTHAFFKALLFLGAGAVIVALGHQQNIFKMGGLRTRLPLVYGLMLVGTLALCGIFPLAGFFSKDAILIAAFDQGHYGLWALGVAVAGVTAFYMFRLFFLVFEGSPATEEPLHVVPVSMRWPMVVLAFGAVGAGWIGVPEALGGENWIGRWFGGEVHLSHAVEYALMAGNAVAVLGGIGLAYWKFKQGFSNAPSVRGNAFYLDTLVTWGIVRPLQWVSAWIAKVADNRGIDGTIMRVCWGAVRLGQRAQILQNGNVRAYAFAILAGVGAVSLYMLGVL